MGVQAVDLFCGVGGLTAGLERAGIPVAAGVDLDPDCAYAYATNNEAAFVEADVTELTASDVKSLFGGTECRILGACAPCQPFSNLNNGSDAEENDDWALIDELGRLVDRVEPELVVMENVPAVRKDRIYSWFVNTLFRIGYEFDVRTIDCDAYGVPQTRKRLLLVASRYGDVELPDPTHLDDPVTVRETIGDLPPIAAGEAHEGDRLHFARTLSDINLKRIRQSRPSGTWEEWDEELVNDCHLAESGRSFGSVYGRMEWDKPAPTMTTQFYNYGSGRFGHPEQDRALSLREGAMLQTFPENYSFVPEDADVEFQSIGRFVGNAVPVRLGELLGQTITDHLETHDVTIRPESDPQHGHGTDGQPVRDVAQPQRAESPGAEPLQ